MLRCSGGSGAGVELGFGGPSCDLPRTLARVHQDGPCHFYCRVLTSTAAVVVRAVHDCATGN
jgi:hypothetical protein